MYGGILSSLKSYKKRTERNINSATKKKNVKLLASLKAVNSKITKDLSYWTATDKSMSKL